VARNGDNEGMICTHMNGDTGGPHNWKDAVSRVHLDRLVATYLCLHISDLYWIIIYRHVYIRAVISAISSCHRSSSRTREAPVGAAHTDPSHQMDDTRSRAVTADSWTYAEVGEEDPRPEGVSKSTTYSNVSP
jgi:hypothetical protein